MKHLCVEMSGMGEMTRCHCGSSLFWVDCLRWRCGGCERSGFSLVNVQPIYSATQAKEFFSGRDVHNWVWIPWSNLPIDVRHLPFVLGQHKT